MKERVIYTLLALFLVTGAYSQDTSDKLYYHSTLEEVTIKSFIEKGVVQNPELQLIADKRFNEDYQEQHEVLLTEWIEGLKEKKEKYNNDQRLIAHMFYKVHRKLLKNYSPFSSLHHTLENGNYDCLSGTTLYAILLSALDYDFEVIETNYHIYLNVHLDEEQTILLESTDPLNGYIDSQTEIKERLSEYQKGNSRQETSEGVYTFKTRMNHSIDLIGLAGLQYYNIAVNAFNSGSVKEAIYAYEKAGIFYNSPRYEEFGLILAQALLSDRSIKENIKRDFLVRIPVMNEESVVSAY